MVQLLDDLVDKIILGGREEDAVQAMLRQCGGGVAACQAGTKKRRPRSGVGGGAGGAQRQGWGEAERNTGGVSSNHDRTPWQWAALPLGEHMNPQNTGLFFVSPLYPPNAAAAAARRAADPRPN